jgi:hypothetical protein
MARVRGKGAMVFAQGPKGKNNENASAALNE